jgi:hypothetical protein
MNTLNAPLTAARHLEFAGWIERLEELAEQGGIEIPVDLRIFRGHYAAGQTPIEALENYATGHGTF